MGANQRELPATLIVSAPLQGLEKCRFRHVDGKSGAIFKSHLVVRACHLRIEPCHLDLQGGYRLPASRQDLHTDPGQLLVPRRKLLYLAELQEMVTSSEHLPIAAVGSQVCGLDLRGKSIDEVSARLRSATQDGQILPSERNGTSPRTALSVHHPSPVFRLSDAAAQLPHDVATHHGAVDRRRSSAPKRQVYRLGTSKRASNQQQSECLEEVGFPLGVRPAQDVETAIRMEGKGTIITKISDRHPLDAHPMFAPMRTSNSHRHNNTERTFLLEAFDDSGAQSVLQFEHNLLAVLRAERIQHVS